MSTELARRAALRGALAALALVAVVIFGARGPGGEDASEREGLHFRFECTKIGDSLDAGAVSCALVVSGLPSPLRDHVSVTLLSAVHSPDAPHASAAGDTLAASEAPAITPGAPVLVAQQLPLAPPLPPPVSLQVPEPPPRVV